MLKTTVEVSIPIRTAAVINGPSGEEILQYLQKNRTDDHNSDDGIFQFQLLLPSKAGGGIRDFPVVGDAKVFINGNSSPTYIEGTLVSLGDAVFEEKPGRHTGPMIRVRYIESLRVGEIALLNEDIAHLAHDLLDTE